MHGARVLFLKERAIMQYLMILAATATFAYATSAQAEIVCTPRGCWETGAKIILVPPSHVRGQPLVSHRNGKAQNLRWLGSANETSPRR
jgi:hypothetical protein